jgi:hypothetical protein
VVSNPEPPFAIVPASDPGAPRPPPPILIVYVLDAAVVYEFFKPPPATTRYSTVSPKSPMHLHQKYLMK